MQNGETLARGGGLPALVCWLSEKFRDESYSPEYELRIMWKLVAMNKILPTPANICLLLVALCCGRGKLHLMRKKMNNEIMAFQTREIKFAINLFLLE